MQESLMSICSWIYTLCRICWTNFSFLLLEFRNRLDIFAKNCVSWWDAIVNPPFEREKSAMVYIALEILGCDACYGKVKWINGTHGTYQSECWEQKRLVLMNNQNEPFSVPDGGDKRDRTADLLNAIDSERKTQRDSMWKNAVISTVRAGWCSFWVPSCLAAFRAHSGMDSGTVLGVKTAFWMGAEWMSRKHPHNNYTMSNETTQILSGNVPRFEVQ